MFKGVWPAIITPFTTDGKIDFIPPQALARRSTQDEINIAFSSKSEGPKVFLATIHGGQNQLLIEKHFIELEKSFYNGTIVEKEYLSNITEKWLEYSNYKNK